MYYFFKDIVIFFVGLACMITGIPGKGSICMIGHRGYSSKHVDNTAESFIAAAEHGSGGVETDVRVTKDNKLILSHNDSAEFEDGTKLVVADSTYDELMAKPLKNKYNKNKVYLCSFKEYLEICRDKNMICFIELKGSFTDEQIVEAFNLAAEVYNLEKCYLQSFDMDNLIRARELFPTLPIMLTYGRGEYDNKVDYTKCFEYGFNIDADFSVVSREMVEEFHSHGLEIGVWTCNNALELNYSYRLGVDFIESDVF